MSTLTEAETDTSTTTETDVDAEFARLTGHQEVLDDGGEKDRFAHYSKKEDIARSAVTREPIQALCGKVWVPMRNPEKYPVCPTCKEIYEALQPGDESGGSGSDGGGGSQ